MTSIKIVLHETEATGWTLLLQVDSILGTPNMIWADGGTHYLWIATADLERRDFSQAQHHFQSG
jgi:uncharacterized protein YwqG